MTRALEHADGGDRTRNDTQIGNVAAVRTNNLSGTGSSRRENGDGGGHSLSETHVPTAAAVPQNFERQERNDTQGRFALDGDGGGHQSHAARVGVVAADPTLIALRLAADTLLDVEGLRTATENRIRALGEIPDWELTPAALRWDAHLTGLRDLEKQVTRELEQAVKQHPLGPFVQRTIGLGLKQAGRLIGALGDPSWNALEGRPRRGPAELWAFCGYAPEQKRRKGVRSNWNAEAKARAHLVAKSCMRQRHGPYRAVYDAARANWAGRDGVTDGHAHAHALRLVAKAVLRDLWVESMQLRAAST
jgi:hypothetical protein